MCVSLICLLTCLRAQYLALLLLLVAACVTFDFCDLFRLFFAFYGKRKVVLCFDNKEKVA